jgi:hypothetical protein
MQRDIQIIHTFRGSLPETVVRARRGGFPEAIKRSKREDAGKVLKLAVSESEIARLEVANI